MAKLENFSLIYALFIIKLQENSLILNPDVLGLSRDYVRGM